MTTCLPACLVFHHKTSGWKNELVIFYPKKYSFQSIFILKHLINKHSYDVNKPINQLKTS